MAALQSIPLPGPGSIYLKQVLIFKKPVRIGDIITARVEIVHKESVKGHITLKTTCTNQNDELVIDGEAIAMPMRL